MLKVVKRYRHKYRHKYRQENELPRKIEKSLEINKALIIKALNKI